jgi:cyclic pyranopterin phosphate synthase
MACGERASMLIDGFSRKIRYLRISITDRCNLRCRYCMPDEGVQWLPHEGIMRYEEMLRIIHICSEMGVDKVRLTGGEPLIRKGLLGFIERIKEIEGINDLSLTTNGVLLYEAAQDLKSAGITRLNISLDTLKKEKYSYITRVDAFDNVMRGIEKAIELGFIVKINVVAISGFNDDEIINFAMHALDKDIEIRFIELMPMGCAARFGNGNVFKAEELKDIIESEYGTLDPVKGGLGPARVFKIKGAKGKIGFIDPMSEHSFCSRCNRIRLTANGHLKLCLFSEDSIDLLNIMRNGISDKELSSFIKESVKLKPGHGIHIDGKNGKGDMNRIGG